MKSPTVAEITPAVGVGASPKGADIGRFPPPHEVGTILQGMTDEEREAQIRRSGIAMQAWYSQYQISGDRECLDLAYACLGRMRELVSGRAPAQIARMEAERGLDLPACANEGVIG